MDQRTVTLAPRLSVQHADAGAQRPRLKGPDLFVREEGEDLQKTNRDRRGVPSQN